MSHSTFGEGSAVKPEGLVDGRIFRYIPHSTPTQIECTVCPKKNGTYRLIELRHIQRHMDSRMHARRAVSQSSGQVSVSIPLTKAQVKRLEARSVPGLSESNIPATEDFDMSWEIDATNAPPSEKGNEWDDRTLASEQLQIPHSNWSVPADNGASEHQQCSDSVVLSELLRDIVRQSSVVVPTETGDTDWWDELKNSMAQNSVGDSIEAYADVDTHSDDFAGAADFGLRVPDESLPEAWGARPSAHVSQDSETYPWPSKSHFITSLLFSSPRIPFSLAQKRAVLNWAKEMGACDVPSVDSMKKQGDMIQELVGDPTERVESLSGNTFYINSVARAIAKDYSNPLTRHTMQDYPEDPSCRMSEVFHGEKMNEKAPSPPSVRVNNSLYFTEELLMDEDGGYFIPDRFFYARYPGEDGVMPVEKELYALGRTVAFSENGFIISDEKELMPTSMFSRPFDDLKAAGILEVGLTASSQKYGKLEPNPLRIKSGGRMVYNVPLIIFMDDVSGNVSKQWNKHHAVYMSNASLPRQMVEKEFCVRFVASSPNAAPMELMQAVKDSVIDAASAGVLAWDCKYGEEVMLIPYILFLAGDNPMQAEECSHGGLSCNYFCRTCTVGGTKEHKESPEGFNALFEPGTTRTSLQTRNEILRQFDLALKPGATTKVQQSTQTTGIRDSTSAAILHAVIDLGKGLRKRNIGNNATPNATTAMSEAEVQVALEKQMEEALRGHTLDDAINPLLGLNMSGMDIHMDTPTETLHTVLLGVVKYFWGQTVWILDKKKLLSILEVRLRSIDATALNAHDMAAEYMIRHRGSLIGKHFKSLAQIMPFLIHDLVPCDVLDAWTLIGELVVLIWHTSIENTEEYLALLSRKIQDFLNVTAKCAPSILISKPKFHFLVHLPAYIRRFGPAIVFSTERYESFNHVFRLSCVYSNRSAPSRDSCRIFARQDIVKHLATGGYWHDHHCKRWRRAGPFVLDYLQNHQAQAQLLGLADFYGAGQTEEPGTGKRTQSTNGGETVVSVAQSRCGKHLPTVPSQTMYYVGSSLIIQERAGETRKVHIGDHVIFCERGSETPSIGLIQEILISDKNGRSVEHVNLQRLTFRPTLHSRIHVPCLDLSSDDVTVSPEAILCAVNVQHNCLDSKCDETETKPVVQGRQQTTKTTLIIKHKPTPNFLLNVYSLHNYSQIKSAIPEHLRQTPLRAVDVDEIRSTAIQQMKAKRGTRKTSSNQAQDKVIGDDITPVDAQAVPVVPSFDRTPARSGNKNSKRRSAKAKCAATATASNQHSNHTVARPSSRESSSVADLQVNLPSASSSSQGVSGLAHNDGPYRNITPTGTESGGNTNLQSERSPQYCLPPLRSDQSLWPTSTLNYYGQHAPPYIYQHQQQTTYSPYFYAPSFAIPRTSDSQNVQDQSHTTQQIAYHSGARIMYPDSNMHM